MEKLVIEGGIPLHGDIRISGAKNAALPLMAATLLCPGRHILRNVPNLRDTRTMIRLLEYLGVQARREGDVLYLNSTCLEHNDAPYEMVKTMRASVLVLGPLLARCHKTRVSLPGGCAIGERPVNFHTAGLQKIGARCSIEDGYINAEAEGGLKGGTVYFDIPTVTGTENLLMAATLAAGKTILKNAAREPEIGNLVDMLNSMGAKISGRDSDTLTIEGVDALQPADNTIIPDRIEAGTYLIAIAASGGAGRVTNCCSAHLPALVEKLRQAGLDVEEGDSFISIDSHQGSALTSVDIQTRPYPGYPTDLQAQFMALMTLAEGNCTIHETIFENRFMHVAELRRMGAKIKTDGRLGLVSGLGRNGLRGAPVMATDLRASSSLVIAALAAEGRTDISRIYHLERGYEDLVEKLSGLGAKVWKEQE
jgi:UDP-N-acetylglucosamine 1-carboxyvinyltransferase